MYPRRPHAARGTGAAANASPLIEGSKSPLEILKRGRNEKPLKGGGAWVGFKPSLMLITKEKEG
jgi:hypothetical protein